MLEWAPLKVYVYVSEYVKKISCTKMLSFGSIRWFKSNAQKVLNGFYNILINFDPKLLFSGFLAFFLFLYLFSLLYLRQKICNAKKFKKM
jgi:hypothetical protein